MMDKPRIRVDFNEMVQKDLVLLSQSDEVIDSNGNACILTEGLKVSLYEQNSYENGEQEFLLAEGLVELNDIAANGEWTSAAKWCCRIDENGVINTTHKFDQATKQARFLLKGYQVDQLHVFSTVLIIEFYSHNTENSGPLTVWLSICGDANISTKSAIATTDFSAEHFFDRRAKLISELYHLMGQQVTDSHVGASGQLEVDFGHKTLFCFKGEGDEMLEGHVWAITSDSSSPDEQHQWSVSLDVDGEIDLRFPTSDNL